MRYLAYIVDIFYVDVTHSSGLATKYVLFGGWEMIKAEHTKLIEQAILGSAGHDESRTE